MARKKTLFDESLMMNQQAYYFYIDRLTELSISMFKWENLPSTIDSRYIELSLFKNGNSIYFNDDVIGNLCLDCVPSGNFDVYGNPTRRRAYSEYNNYSKALDETNSVIIWNNMLRKNSYSAVEMFSKKLYILDRIIDVNSNAQKTPVLLQGTDKQRLTLLNLYKEFDGNAPFIFGDKNLDLGAITAINTNAPYISDKIYDLKSKIWNEALTYLGISNVTITKKERMITDEVARAQGGTIASRYSRLQARKDAVEKINNMFGTSIKVSYKEDSDNVSRETLDQDEESGDSFE